MGKGGSQTIGYKYNVGMHLIDCHGPIDYYSQVKVADRVAWSGIATGGPVTIDAPELFGGDLREGGVSGIADVCLGYPDQLQNEYLLAKVDPNVPAFRGVSGWVLNQMYLGNNPYLKNWQSRGKRIHVAQEGAEQWYDAKAEIPDSESMAPEGYEGATVQATFFQRSALDFPVENYAYVGIGFLDEAGDDIIPITWSTAPGGDMLAWESNNLTAVAPAGTVTIRIWMKFDKHFNIGRYGFIDSLEVTINGEPFGLINPEAEAGVLGWNYFGANNLVSYAHDPGWPPEDPHGMAHSGAFYFGATTINGIEVWQDAFPIVLGQGGDMNPSHIIRESLTNSDWGMGYTDDDIDDDSFIAAADTLYDEGLGMSLLWDKQVKIEDFINEIVRHADAALYVSRETGKFVLDLIRFDYDPDSLILLDESNILKITSPSRPAPTELVNSLTVNFWNKSLGKDDSVTISDSAAIINGGPTIGTTVQYPGFTKIRNATIACQRDLRSLSSPILSCVIYTTRIAKDLKPGKAFKFSWSKWHVATIMRVISIAFGDGRSNQIKITCVEDVYASETEVVISHPGEGWVDPSQPPENIDVSEGEGVAFEAPYYELAQSLGQANIDSQLSSNPEIGFVLAGSIRPANAINAQLWTDAGGGYAGCGAFDFCANVRLSAAAGKTDTTLHYANAEDLAYIELGDYFKLGDEICRIDAIDTGALTITVGRGCLDTVPAEHAEDELIMFVDDYRGYDTTEYVLGETVNVKILPFSGMGGIAIGDATAIPVTMDQRAYRPYAPGDLRVNGDSYLPGPYAGILTTTFKDRDRLTQTGGTIYDHTFGNIGPEAGTTYRIRFYLDGVLQHTEEPATSGFTYAMAASGTGKIRVDSKRDGVYSWQAAEHEFEYSSTGFLIDESSAGDFIVAESGEYIVAED